MKICDRSDKFLIVGAGAAGLAAIKALTDRNIPFDAVESYRDIGGLWHYDRPGSPIYKNTHTIGNKQLQTFSGFPMPDHYPDYPSHGLVVEYLRSYARKFGLYDRIQFQTSVKTIEKDGNCWQVALTNGETRHYRGVLLATGYHNKPKYPEYAGIFAGRVLHSKDYSVPEQLNDKNVLVVGAGQSAMDILEDAATTAKKTFHSTRRGFLNLNKYILGFPGEMVANFPLLKPIPTQIIFKLLAFIHPLALILQGIKLSQYKIPVNCARNGIINPVFNSVIYQYYMQGDITHKPNIQELKGDRVLFEDGTEEPIDLIIYATGYQVEFPFIDKQLLNWSEGTSHPNLYLHTFHPRDDSIFAIGMIHPIGTHWHVFEAQSQLVAAYIQAADRQSRAVRKFNQIKLKFQEGIQQCKNTAAAGHSLIVDKRHYIKRTQQLVKQLSA